MENAGSDENDGEEGRERKEGSPRNDVQIDEAVAAGSLIGAAFGLLCWLFGKLPNNIKINVSTGSGRAAMGQGSPPVTKSGVRRKAFQRSDGQAVTGVYIDCESQAEAFRAAMAKDKQTRRPVLHAPPHGEDWDESGRWPAYNSTRWHYHPYTHDVWEDDRLMDYHYTFSSNDRQRILATDSMLREQF